MESLPETRISTDDLGYVGDMIRWGASVEKVCETLGVGVESFRAEMASGGELAKVVREARLMRDTDIQRAFFQAAVGGFRTTTVKRHVQKEDGSRQMEVTEKTEYHRADPKLMALMLKNIDPWFTEKDAFERRLALESQLIRKQLAGGSDWKPVTSRVTKVRATAKRGERVWKGGAGGGNENDA